jgi:hypothetical protein
MPLSYKHRVTSTGTDSAPSVSHRPPQMSLDNTSHIFGKPFSFRKQFSPLGVTRVLLESQSLSLVEINSKRSRGTGRQGETGRLEGGARFIVGGGRYVLGMATHGGIVMANGVNILASEIHKGGCTVASALSQVRLVLIVLRLRVTPASRRTY